MGRTFVALYDTTVPIAAGEVEVGGEKALVTTSRNLAHGETVEESELDPAFVESLDGDESVLREASESEVEKLREEHARLAAEGASAPGAGLALEDMTVPDTSAEGEALEEAQVDEAHPGEPVTSGPEEGAVSAGPKKQSRKKSADKAKAEKADADKE